MMPPTGLPVARRFAGLAYAPGCNAGVNDFGSADLNFSLVSNPVSNEAV